MNKKFDLKTHNQKSAYASPWSLKQRLLILLWNFVWTFFCSWTPKPFNTWRLFFLKKFGAKIYGYPFVHQSAKIQIPWNLTMHDRSCLGDGVYAYSLDEIEILENATVAQQVYLCTGTHKFSDPNRPLQTAKIKIGKNSFIGARAFIMPGILIGDDAIVAACSVVTCNVISDSVVAGNPAREINNNFKLKNK